MDRTVTLIRNYQKGNRVLLKGTVIGVTPWFRRELMAGNYISQAIETTMKKEKKEIR